MNSAQRRVESHLSDGDAHAAGALVTQPQNSLAVAHNDAFHAVVPLVKQDLADAVLIRITQKQASRLSPDFAEPLAAFAHRRCVDERQHLLDVAHQQGVEKRLVDVLKIAKEAVFGERGGLAVEREHPAFHLLVKRADVWRQQAVQTKKVALVVGESRSFVQPRRIDKADARKRNLHRVLALSTLRVVSHCVSLPTVPGNSGLRRTRMIPLDDSLRSPALALASPNPSLGF